MKSRERHPLETFALGMVFLPLDLIRFTKDITRIVMLRHLYRKVRRFRDQPCSFCMGGDTGRSPRPLPPGVMRYHNRWLILPWMPCRGSVRVPCRSGTRKEIGCLSEGGYVRIGAGAVCCAVLVWSVWIFLLLVLMVKL